MKKTVASAACGLLAITMASSASAAPLVGADSFRTTKQSHSESNHPGIMQVGWRHGWHRHGWHGHPHRYGWGPAVGGFAAGAIIGSALASSHAQANADAYCEQKYRSYDPGSGTYLGYDGERHPCP
jgi:hypothetical protein